MVTAANGLSFTLGLVVWLAAVVVVLLIVHGLNDYQDETMEDREQAEYLDQWKRDHPVR